MSESTCFLTGKEPPEQLYDVVSFGLLIADYLENTGRERSALSLCHECVKLLKFCPPGDYTEALKCRTYQAIAILCDSVDDLKGAIKYREMSLEIQEAIRDTFPDLCTWKTHSALGDLYGRYGNFKKAIESLEQALVLAEDSNDRAEVCHALSQLHIVLGNHERAAEYLRNIKKSGVTKQAEFDNLLTEGMQFESSGKPGNAILCFERALSISQQMEDKGLECIIFQKLGGVHLDMKNLKEALMYYERSFGLAKEVGYKDVQRGLCYLIALVAMDLGDARKAHEHAQMGFAISEELQDLHGKIHSLITIGSIFQMGGDDKQAIAAFEKALKHYEEMEDLAETRDDLRVSIGSTFGKKLYSFLTIALICDDQREKALIVADRGRTRALAALMRSKYGINTSSGYHKALTHTEISQMIGKGSRFLITCLVETMICVWFLAPNGDIKWHNILPVGEGKVNDYLTSVVDKSCQIIVPQPDAKCEDRSLPGLDRNQDESTLEQPHSVPGSSADLLWKTLQKKPPKSRIFTSNKKPWNAKGPPLAILHNLMVTPVLAELLGETNEEDKAEELVFAPDGPLCLAPFAASQGPNGRSLIDKFRIRVIPSLITLNHILCSPADYHCNTGALIVGDPNVGDVQYKGQMHRIDRLPFAKQEAEMIGRLLKVEPLTGDKATKEEVLKRMGSVSLVHLAAHGDSERGEIALAPDPATRSGIVEEKDFLLSMGDVLNAKLRAKLVVLSCCHSGRGDIKAEGVIGIARAFLGAGTRSVLVSLWGIEDEATLFFMKHFYRQLVQGESASVANHHATRKLKNSEKFNAAKHWAPFMLIGDDVKISVGQ